MGFGDERNRFRRPGRSSGGCCPILPAHRPVGSEGSVVVNAKAMPLLGHGRRITPQYLASIELWCGITLYNAGVSIEEPMRIQSVELKSTIDGRPLGREARWLVSIILPKKGC